MGTSRCLSSAASSSATTSRSAPAPLDRGGSGDTVIGEDTKIDNLVHIAHNATIGRHCIIAGQCGLAGSVTLGDGVMLGGQVGIADHVMIGDGAMIGAKSGVVSNVPPGEKWFGYAAFPGRGFLCAMTVLRKYATRAGNID